MGIQSPLSLDTQRTPRPRYAPVPQADGGLEELTPVKIRPQVSFESQNPKTKWGYAFLAIWTIVLATLSALMAIRAPGHHEILQVYCALKNPNSD
jgi:hypothetical protein